MTPARLAILAALPMLLGCSLEHPIAVFLDASDASAVDAATDAGDDVVTEDRAAPDVVDAATADRALPDVVDAPPPDDVFDAATDLPTDAVVEDRAEIGADIVESDAPVSPDVVDVPALPDVVDVPALPDVVDAPALPDVVDVPALPDVVDAPALPDVVEPVDAGMIYESCEAVRLAGRPSGAYLIRVGGTTPWLAYCDTGDSGGAWTLVLKADGRQATFGYDAALWTNTAVLNPTSVDLERVEAKFQGFIGLPVRQLRVQMVSPPTAAYSARRETNLTLSGGRTLQQIFSAGTYVDLSGDTSEGVWFALIPNSALQLWCHRRGLNVRGDNSGADRVRVGMIGNENVIDSCASHDSRLGVGGAGNACGGGRETNTVGNAAGCTTLADRDIRAFAYLWVR